MIVDLPENLEAALKVQANAKGVSPEGYLFEVLDRLLSPAKGPKTSYAPFKTGHGILAKYGQAPSDEAIEANRADMFSGFGERL